MLIPLSQIAVVERRRKDLGNLQDLVGSIKSHGQITPGVVRTATDADRERGVDPLETPFVLVAGGRRYAACALAGIEQYEARDVGELSLLEQKILELEENLNRKDLNWDEEVLLKEEIHKLRQSERPDWNQEALASELHETPANTSRDLRLARAIQANPELRRAPSKAAAVRQLSYDTKISERTAAIESTPMLLVADRLVTADMRDYVRTLPTHSIDLCFTDFPFGIEYEFGSRERNKYADSQQALMDLLTDVIPEIVRVTKPTGWLALMMGSTNYQFLCDLLTSCCAEHFEYAEVIYEQQENGEWERKVMSQCGEGPRGTHTGCRFLRVEDPEWLWFRPNSRQPSMWPEIHVQNQYEKIAVVNMGSAVIVRKNLGNVLVHDAIYEDRIHEMQRPHSLCLDVVSRLSLGGERVLDLCYGSGSALAAAAELERDFLGCDLNPANRGPALMWVAEHFQKAVVQ